MESVKDLRDTRQSIACSRSTHVPMLAATSHHVAGWWGPKRLEGLEGLEGQRVLSPLYLEAEKEPLNETKHKHLLLFWVQCSLNSTE